MTFSPLDALLQRLSDGNEQAAEEAFRTYEPLLRRVVRRRLRAGLRAKFDSADVVQSIWADLLTGFRAARWHFADAAQHRAFLVKATRNRFLDRLRQSHAALAHEQPLDRTAPRQLPPAPQPPPSECAQADDVWHKLLALCPPEHHEVLRLRRRGLTRAEIATHTGLHEGSVRRILRGLARQLAFPSPRSAAPPG